MNGYQFKKNPNVMVIKTEGLALDFNLKSELNLSKMILILARIWKTRADLGRAKTKTLSLFSYKRLVFLKGIVLLREFWFNGV